MPTTDSRLLTADEYRQMPADGRRYQLVEGELIMARSPNRRHQHIVANLADALRSHVRRRRLGQVYFAPLDVYLDEHNVFQPDLVFVATAHAGVLVPEGIRGAPDLVVEILSPSTAQLDKRRKLKLYATHGVRELWLVDPSLEQVQVYELARDASRPTRVLEVQDTLATPLLPGLDLRVGEIFAE